MSAGMPCSSSNACFHATAPAPPVETSVPSMSNRRMRGESFIGSGYAEPEDSHRAAPAAIMGDMATLPRTEHRVARSLAETLDPQEALERALAAIGEGLGWRLGAAWEPPPGEPEVLVCVETWCAPGVDDAEFVARLSRPQARARRGPSGAGVGDGRGGVDRRRPGRRELPARLGGCLAPACTPPSASRSGARAACWAWSSSTPARRASWTPSCSR